MDPKLIDFTTIDHPPWKTIQDVAEKLLTDYEGTCTFFAMCSALSIPRHTGDELKLARCLNGLDVPDLRSRYLVADWCKEQIKAIQANDGKSVEETMPDNSVDSA
ncbi:MAG: hypothetical protein JWN70_2998 [Planctomycetaceae bacterium]|nr:hypothetical protein [Planctomycetaceae bacterium]